VHGKIMSEMMHVLFMEFKQLDPKWEEEKDPFY